VLTRVLVANRGECAVRIVRACHDLGIEAVAVYSTADRDGLWIEQADRAVCIGPHQPAESYLNVSNLIGAAETTGCDAVHPGWGFLAENAGFVRVCSDNDLVFVGPPAEAMEVMGDKSRARERMREAGVPLVPGSLDRLGGADHARTMAAEIGYPVLLKATAGGGGRGMRLVTDPADIEDAYGVASAEALTSFGDGGMYLERAVVGARHVEMQVLADAAGGVLVLGERDCSIQRRHQKLIEEGPSPALDAATRDVMADAARRACLACDYVNAGTVEFLLDREGNPFFIEMNTRLQVEHPVSELVTGIDIAAWQLRIAGGETLPATGLAPLRGHAIEFRINCEDPRKGFMPAAGTVTRFRAPLGAGVRVDTHAYEGYRVPPFYDSMLAKVIVHGSDRGEALARARRALGELEIEGVATTRDLFLEIVDEPGFRSGAYTTAYLEDARAALPSLSEGQAVA
jgi:acetyl-CoA carboxylase, biotin carboxylase subunit